MKKLDIIAIPLLIPSDSDCRVTHYLSVAVHLKLRRGSFNGPLVTRGGTVPPLGLVFKLPKNGFSEAPPKLHKFLEHFFGKILVKFFLVI